MLGLSPRITGLYGADCALSLAPAAASEPGGGSELPWRPTLLAGSGYVTRTKRPHVYVYELPPRLTTWVNVRRLDRPTHNLFTQVWGVHVGVGVGVHVGVGVPGVPVPVPGVGCACACACIAFGPEPGLLLGACRAQLHAWHAVHGTTTFRPGQTVQQQPTIVPPPYLPDE